MDPGVEVVVGVLEHVFDVITSRAAGPEDVTVSDADPDERPDTAAVMVQVPGEPVMVTVDVVLCDPALIVALVGETLQTPPLSTLKVTVCAVCDVVAAPLASLSVAVTVVVRGLPEGNSLWPSVTPTDVGAPALVNATLTTQPVNNVLKADS